MKKEESFWQTKSLQEMNAEEWEALCDGCGHCCLHKLQDEDDNKIYITRIACELLDIEQCKCTDYPNRLQRVSMCEQISLHNITSLSWLPSSCAYICLYEGRPLPEWHPLISKQKNSVEEAGVSVKSFALSEVYVHPDEWQDCIIKVL